jgi:hypothetical protein
VLITNTEVAERATSSVETTPRTATKPVTKELTEPVTRNLQRAATALQLAAFVLAGVGVAINASFANSLGSTQLAAWLFTALGVGVDVAALALPSCAARAWQQGRPAAATTGWSIWVITLAFAVTAAIGFAERQHLRHHVSTRRPDQPRATAKGTSSVHV